MQLLQRVAITASLLMALSSHAHAQQPIIIDPEDVPDLFPVPECGPSALTTTVHRLSRCVSGLAPVCVNGRYKCERCNGIDDTGQGIPDEGRDELCNHWLSNNECGPGECVRIPVFESGPWPRVLRWDTQCIYPEDLSACDDGNRCTTDSCQAGRCQYEAEDQCYNVAVTASTRRWANMASLTLRITGGKPNAAHVVVVSQVPNYAERRFTVITNEDGEATYTTDYPYRVLPPCGPTPPAVQVRVSQGSNSARTSVAARALRPCT